MSYSEKLKQLRGTKSQRVVAESVGISTSTLGMYEQGERIPRDDIKIKLAEYYGVTVGYIFFDEE